jgi:endonuclease/exonuclease/phosphatase family metal-dependent hydrolase
MVVVGWLPPVDGASPRPVKRTKGGFRTKREALDYCVTMRGSKYTPERKAPTLMDYWLAYEGGEFEQLSKSKQMAYKGAWKKLEPLHWRRVDQIGVTDLRGLVADVAPTHYTARDCKTVLTKLFELAGADGWCPKDLPSYIVLPKLEEKERRVFSDVEQGALWLSDTPSEPYTKFEDSKSCRHCTWAILKDTFTGRELFVCNTHLDTASEAVRLKQLAVLQENLGGYMEQYPTLLVGDFNSRPDSGVYAAVSQTLSDPHVTAAVKLSNTEFTYDNYGTEDDPCRLDYLFYNEGLVAETYRVMIDLYNGYVSDHYGVTTQYSFAK